MVNLGLLTMVLGAAQLAIAVTLLTTYAIPVLAAGSITFVAGAGLYFFADKPQNNSSDITSFTI